ncbi:MAG: ABC transporter permease [Christensenellales bacterium]|jgi:osmoprotectant transport system permease protein
MNTSLLAGWIFEHLAIVLIAGVISVAVGLILAIIGYWLPSLGKLILALADIIQTIPSLALLAILMIWLGLGNATMIAGLVLYSLLPIVRNTHTGLLEIEPYIKDAAKGMGMTRTQRLLQVELPLALPLIFTGVKISIVTSLGIAVLGVLIGAGGLGGPIFRGFQTENLQMLLSGAIPVIIMAAIFDFFMGRIEKRLINRAETK